MNKIVGIVLNILIAIVVIIILIILYSLIQTKILKKDYVNFFGYTVLQVKTGSMRNTLEEKDIILIKVLKEKKIDDLKKDDIILYKQENSLVVHRIIRKEESNFITKGDANNQEDNPIPKDDVIGKMEKTILKVGIWEKVISTPQVYISLIITICLCGVTFFYGRDKKDTEVREDAKTKD